MDNNFSAYMLADQTLHADAGTLAVKVRLPWYRALPLSTVEVARLRIDGHDVAPEQIRFEINGHAHPLSECADRIDDWWYVLDDGILHVSAPALAAQPDHLVEVTLNLYPPYMPGFTWVTHSSKRLKAQP